MDILLCKMCHIAEFTSCAIACIKYALQFSISSVATVTSIVCVSVHITISMMRSYAYHIRVAASAMCLYIRTMSQLLPAPCVCAHTPSVSRQCGRKLLHRSHFSYLAKLNLIILLLSYCNLRLRHKMLVYGVLNTRKPDVK